MQTIDIALDASLRIVSKFLSREIDNEPYVQMKWTISNDSKSKLQVVGYYCPFYYWTESGEKSSYKLKGVFIPDREKWKESEFMISNEHVRLQLWPGESRTYIWAVVRPSYYGMDAGNWSYRLRIYYQIIGVEGVFYNEGPDTSIGIKDAEAIRKTKMLDAFLSNPELINSELKQYTDRYKRIIMNPSRRRNRYTSYLLEQDTFDHLLIETYRRVTRNAIYDTQKLLHWVNEITHYQYLKGKRIVIGKEATPAATRAALRTGNEVMIFIAEVQNGKVILSRIH